MSTRLRDSFADGYIIRRSEVRIRQLDYVIIRYPSYIVYQHQVEAAPLERRCLECVKVLPLSGATQAPSSWCIAIKRYLESIAARTHGDKCVFPAGT